MFQKLVVAILLLSLPVLVKAASVEEQDFFKLADEYFDRYYFPEDPPTATWFGLHQYDSQLNDLSKKTIAKEITQLKQFEARCAQINLTLFSEQAQGDYALVRNSIRSQLLTRQVIKPLEKNPDYYSSYITNGAFVIMERQFAPVELRLRALIAREKLMPAILQEAHHNLKNPPQIYTEIALEQLPGIIHFFQQEVPAAFPGIKDPSLQKDFTLSNGAVIKALMAYQTWLKNEILPQSHGDFRIGKAAFVKKLQYDEMVDMPLDELLKINADNRHQNQREFNRLSQELYPHQSHEEILAELAKNHPPASEVLPTFGNEFDNLIRFIHAKKIITIPSETKPTMEETPPFLRATTTASMDSPGPFEATAKEAYFYVSLPNPEWSAAKTDDFLKRLNYPAISVIAVHETYPGHYVQFLWMRTLSDRVRKILGAFTNIEGWAHYTEQMMLDEGLGTPGDNRKLRLGQLSDALLRNARFEVGIKMHTGQMTLQQAVDFFVSEGYQTRSLGWVEAKRGTADPTYLYYTLGKLQILKLRADLMAKEGKAFSLQKFHDDFMRQGCPPIKIVRKALLHEDSATL